MKKMARITARDILLGFMDAYVLVMWSNPYGRCRKEYYEYFRWRRQKPASRSRISSSIHYLKRKQLVEVYQTKTGKFIELTDAGKRELTKYFIQNRLELPKDRVWDGRWRVVVFDIPESNKYGREVFRDTLKRLGFVKLQKSVFVYPYECYKEVSFIRDFYGMSDDIKYMVVEKIEAGVDLVKLFFDQGIITGIR